MNWFFLNGTVRRKLKGKDYCVVDIVFPISSAFTDCLTGYTKSPKRTRVHVMYRSLMSNIVPDDRKRGWTTKELKATGAEVCEFKQM